MSGIVRGWTDANELQDLTEGVYAHVCADSMHSTLDHPFPVAVVPLDDATLAGCVEKARDAYREQWHIEFDATDGDIDEAARLRIWSVAISAALGIGGEPSTNATEPRG